MKDTNIIIRCTDMYKDSIREEAEKLDMTISQYFRFCNICKANLEKNAPEFYAQLVEMTKYMDF